MPRPRSVLAAAAAALSALLPAIVAAQAQFSINNPLVRPPGRGLTAATVPAPEARKEPAPEPALPVARPVPDPHGPQATPWPAQGGGVPTQSGDAAAKDELSAYTVVAIVGEAAVLRTNVGATVPGASGAGAPGGTQGAPLSPATATSTTAARQLAMRVRNGLPVLVAGASVVPTVGTSTVEFRSARSKTLLFTASLDSQSPPTFVPTTREAVDPAVAARTTPTPPNITGMAKAPAYGSNGGHGGGGPTPAR